MYDDNFYFNNPVDYLANQSDPWFYDHIRDCDIHIATGCGQWEKQRAELPPVRRSWPAKAFGIRWTTGATRAGTTGPTGSTR